MTWLNESKYYILAAVLVTGLIYFILNDAPRAKSDPTANIPSQSN